MSAIEKLNQLTPRMTLQAGGKDYTIFSVRALA